jgi:hypothetical protein
LRAFMGVRLWTGMRKQPNIKTFWTGNDDLFHCPKILGLFTRKHFETLSKCLHLTNMDDGMSDRNSPNYDKVGQCRWLIDVIRNKVVTRTILDGRTDSRTMAAGASVTWMHCSVLFKVTWVKQCGSARTSSPPSPLPPSPPPSPTDARKK